MTIWVDSVACPRQIKVILFRAAERTGVDLYLLANQPVSIPALMNVQAIRVSQGFDVADDEIVRRVQGGDLVITSDIPLAAEVIEKGALALSSRGEQFSASTKKARLNMRDFMDTLRSSGIHSGGPSQLSETDKREFANALDRYLVRKNTAGNA